MKIVITGGPCAGKTAAMERIRVCFMKMGYAVILVQETATEMILSGITPWNRPDFQSIRVARQLEAEEQALQRAQAAERMLMVFDRGIPDTAAYADSERYERILSENHLDRVAALERYDAVIHLTTAAKGSSDAYNLKSNAARVETPAEAAQLDDGILAAWDRHPKRIIIPAEDVFETKMSRLLDTITQILES